MFVLLRAQPGVYKNGTTYQGRGSVTPYGVQPPRFNDANLYRWHEGKQGPVGGWRPHSTSAVTGKGRALLTWRDNGSVVHIAIGTESHLYAMARDGALSDITPVGYVAGRADATTGGGFGSGPYGRGAYGAPRLDTSLVRDATVWSLDTWGEHLIGCTPDDGKIYEWALNTATPAAQIANSPTARSVLATAERFVFALGAGGDPRSVAWCDQENNTVWTPSTTNQAGSFPLQTSGQLQCGRRITGGALLFTDVDVWLASYVGFPLVYGFTRAGSGCGVISPQAVAVLDSRAVWMGGEGFHIYNGFVANQPCEVSDYVFGSLNRAQASKVSAFHNSAFSEVWWFYPGGSSLENDSYVAWNYVEDHWSVGKLSRLSSADRGVLRYPLLCGPDGIVYEHEVGTNYDGMTPYARLGPLELGSGDQVMNVRALIPDSDTLGGVTATFYPRLFPDEDPVPRGPYPLTKNTDIRFSARQLEVQFNGGSRLGIPRLEGVAGGGR